jgi:hypothetical protein
VLLNLQALSDDRAYYAGVKTYARQTLIARISEATYTGSKESSRIRKVSRQILAGALRLELHFLSASGLVNEWGRSIGRALLVGAAIVLGFFILYVIADAHVTGSNFLAAIEITLLFGYTKYALLNSPLWLQVTECLNALLGLWWYAVLVPTVVNRISRVHA